MTVMKDKLIKAVADKKNDIKLFVWKFPKKADKTQEEIKLVEGTPEQLISFYKHCQSMLYSDDKVNPGRYTLLNLINEQRRKCNVELYPRRLEDGSLCRDGQPYPRYLYFQDIRSFIDQNKEKFEGEDWKSLSISAVTGDMPREYKRISSNEVMDGCLDQLGVLSTKHITFSFILNLGICLTNAELKEFDEKDKDGKTRSKLEVIKERLGLKDSIRLMVKDGGLTYKEFRAMINLKTKVKYSELTPDQLVTLRNKVLFRLEKEVQYHISQWEDRIRQIKLVCKAKNIELPEMD